MRSAYLIIAHGSREKEANDAFERLIEDFRRLHPDRHVQAAYLEIAKPGIPEAIQKCRQEGATEIFVIPLMLFPGRHVKEHIPAFIQKAKEEHPEIDFHYSGPLCEDESMLQTLEEKLRRLKGEKRR